MPQHVKDRIHAALVKAGVAKPLPARIEVVGLPTGWALLDALTGIGGYPQGRLTHIHGPAHKTLELTRGWGERVRLNTHDDLERFRVIKGRFPERVVVDATALIGPEPLKWWARYDRIVMRLAGARLPSTIVWLTSGAPTLLPKGLKFAAHLRLECRDDQLIVVKSSISTRQGYFMPMPEGFGGLGLD
jgi:hypothetical protein